MTPKSSEGVSQGNWISFPCLEVTQPIGTFYVGVLPSKSLVNLSYSDVRRPEGQRRDVERYLGIERPLDQKRVAEIREYVGTVDASFPSPIIVAVDASDTQYDSGSGMFRVRDLQGIAKVLDGQHRLAGLATYEEAFDLVVTIFVDMDIENQALLFATINLEQTKVSKSLAYDLYEYARQRSPQKSAHNIVRLLDSEAGSPFLGKIKILGTAGNPEETLSQAVLVDALLPLVSANPVEDRDLVKRGKRLPRATPDEERSLILRNMWLDNEDEKIARVLWNYFGAVEDRWEDSWRVPRRGNMLNRTTGFRGLMLFLRPSYLACGGPERVPTRAQFRELFDKVKLEGEDFTPANYRPGSSGQSKLRNDLLEQTGLSADD